MVPRYTGAMAHSLRFLMALGVVVSAGCGGATTTARTTPDPVAVSSEVETLDEASQALVSAYLVLQDSFGEDLDAAVDEGAGGDDDDYDDYEDESGGGDDDDAEEPGEEDVASSPEAIAAEGAMSQLRDALDAVTEAQRLVPPTHSALGEFLASTRARLQDESDAWPEDSPWSYDRATREDIVATGRTAHNELRVAIEEWLTAGERPDPTLAGSCGAAGVVLHATARDLWLDMFFAVRDAEQEVSYEEEEFLTFQDEELAALAVVIRTLETALLDGEFDEDDITEVIDADGMAEPETYLNAQAATDYTAAFEQLVDLDEGPMEAAARELLNAAIDLRDARHPRYETSGELRATLDAFEVIEAMRDSMPSPGPLATAQHASRLLAFEVEPMGLGRDELERMVDFTRAACAR